MTFSTGTIAAFLVGGILAILIPIAALIIFKLKNKDVKLRYFFIGAATFVAFALILEQILHYFMLSTIQNSGVVFYTLYGALCAGIFEETGRFLAFKLFCKNENDPRASIMYGLGHGGVEAVVLVGITLISYAVTAMTVNALGTEALFGALPDEQRWAAEAQIAALTDYDMVSTIVSLAERILAIVLHTALSVIVFASIKMKGKLWLYPAAIVLHALFDVPAALYQRGVITGIAVTELLLLAADIVLVLITIKIYKAMKAELAERSEQLIAAEPPAEEPEKINSTSETE